MNRKNLFIATMLLTAILILPQTGSTNKGPLNDTELCDVIGQEGSIVETTIPINIHFDNLSELNGVLNFHDLNFQGSITTRDSSTSITNAYEIADLIFPYTGMFSFGLVPLESIGKNPQQFDMTIKIDDFSIGAIQPGNAVKGPGFGSVQMSGGVINFKGTLIPATSH